MFLVDCGFLSICKKFNGAKACKFDVFSFLNYKARLRSQFA